ncbi:methyltransferase domain-containing protein [Candidatus Bathyarchaeota archaeon]|nr:MAG: methyltransferase domain-containing protein [Candidatus Bathyarchaeota archaeon]
MMTLNKTHPWELAWREGRWEETSPPLPEVVEFAQDLKREGAKTILDLGCGAGRHSILLGKQGFQVVALDISETALNTLDGRLKVASIANVSLVKHEMRDLPFIDGYFDGIICTNVLHHGNIVEIKRTAGEIRRVMREGASALIVALSAADFRKGNGKKLEPNTYVFTEGDERGIIHHFFSRSELESCLKGAKIVSFKERMIPVEEGGNRAHFLVTLKKP